MPQDMNVDRKVSSSRWVSCGEPYLMAEGLKAGLRALRTAFHMRSSECGAVNRV